MRKTLTVLGGLGLLIGLYMVLGASPAAAYPGSGDTPQDCLVCHVSGNNTATEIYMAAHDGAIGECNTCHAPEVDSIHGEWNETPSACARCHRTHSAVEASLLTMGKDDLCLFCHGSVAGLAQTDVIDGVLQSTGEPLRGGGFDQAIMNTSTNAGDFEAGGWEFPVGTIAVNTTSKHTLGVTATIWGAASADAITAEANAGNVNTSLECVSCHDPHAYGLTYRMLSRTPEGAGVPKHPTPADFQQRVFVTDQLTYKEWNPSSNILRYTVDDYTDLSIANRTYMGSGVWAETPIADSSYAAPDVLDPATGDVTTVYTTTGSVAGTMYSQQLNEWCASCHDRYHAQKVDRANPGSTDSGDVIFAYRHKTGDDIAWNDTTGRYETSSCAYRCHDNNNDLSCLGCHVAHGTTAQMSPAITGMPWPGEGGGAYDVRDDGATLGDGLPEDTRTEFTGPTDFDGEGRSNLLRLDNRGVCQNTSCHPMGTEAYLEAYD